MTAEVVTAAILNTDVRDNLLETAPATVTTAGDLTYATAANALARLAAGTTAQFLRGATVPTWSNVLLGDLDVGDASNVARLRIYRSIGHLQLHETDAADAADHWILEADVNQLRVRWRDDSLATDHPAMDLDQDDFILHSGAKGTGEGAVVIVTDTVGGPTALTTTGSVVLSASVNTGGPAYVEGFWMVQIERTDATSVSSLSIIPREDGTNLSTWFRYDGTNTGIPVIIPAVNDIHTFGGMFWRRVTATDTSAYQIFITAGDNSRFQIINGHLFCRSIQYPT